MPHTPQDALLAAVLHVLDAPRDEEGHLIDPETAAEEFSRIASYKGDAERLSLEGETNSPSIADTIITTGLNPALAVAEEIRRKVRRMARKKYPPRS